MPKSSCMQNNCEQSIVATPKGASWWWKLLCLSQLPWLKDGSLVGMGLTLLKIFSTSVEWCWGVCRALKLLIWSITFLAGLAVPCPAQSLCSSWGTAGVWCFGVPWFVGSDVWAAGMSQEEAVAWGISPAGCKWSPAWSSAVLPMCGCVNWLCWRAEPGHWRGTSGAVRFNHEDGLDMMDLHWGTGATYEKIWAWLDLPSGNLWCLFLLCFNFPLFSAYPSW